MAGLAIGGCDRDFDNGVAHVRDKGNLGAKPKGDVMADTLAAIGERCGQKS